MAFVFGGGRGSGSQPRVDPIRECRRSLSRGIRSIDREAPAARKEEAMCLADVKSAAKLGDIVGVRTASVRLVRIRARIRRQEAMVGKLRAMENRISEIGSCNLLTKSMLDGTNAMRTVSGTTDFSSISRIIREFDRQNGMMDERMEMMDEAIDNMEETENEECETNDMVAQVLAEVGIDMDDVIFSAPSAKVRAGLKSEDSDIEARLASLKGHSD